MPKVKTYCPAYSVGLFFYQFKIRMVILLLSCPFVEYYNCEAGLCENAGMRV